MSAGGGRETVWLYGKKIRGVLARTAGLHYCTSHAKSSAEKGGDIDGTVRVDDESRVKDGCVILDQQLEVGGVDLVSSGENERAFGRHPAIEKFSPGEFGQWYDFWRWQGFPSQAHYATYAFMYCTVVVPDAIAGCDDNVPRAEPDEPELLLCEKKMWESTSVLKYEVAFAASYRDGSGVAEAADNLQCFWLQGSPCVRDLGECEDCCQGRGYENRRFSSSWCHRQT